MTPLQFLCFGEVPLLFAYSERYHYNSCFVTATPCSTYGTASGPPAGVPGGSVVPYGRFCPRLKWITSPTGTLSSSLPSLSHLVYSPCDRDSSPATVLSSAAAAVDATFAVDATSAVDAAYDPLPDPAVDAASASASVVDHPAVYANSASARLPPTW